jgi:flagellar assembly factor FliW
MAMRVLSTDRFGEVTVDDDEVIALPEGLLGFDAVVEIVVLPVDENGRFFWLQAVNDPSVAFLALTPWPMFADYDLDLPDVDQDALELHDAGDALVFCLVTSHDNPRRFTVNLAGPVIINQRNRRGRQVVLENGEPTQADLPQIS